MASLRNLSGKHKLVTLEVPGRRQANMLCLLQQDRNGVEAYYVLAECEGRALHWRSMIRDNAIRRLRDEFIGNITAEHEVDTLDVETIFFCTTELTKT